jgi:hypothetical protein
VAGTVQRGIDRHDAARRLPSSATAAPPASCSPAWHPALLLRALTHIRRTDETMVQGTKATPTQAIGEHTKAAGSLQPLSFSMSARQRTADGERLPGRLVLLSSYAGSVPAHDR